MIYFDGLVGVDLVIYLTSSTSFVPLCLFLCLFLCLQIIAYASDHCRVNLSVPILRFRAKQAPTGCLGRGVIMGGIED